MRGTRLRRFLTYSLAALALAFAWPAAAQQWIQIPVCGGPLPTTVNPSAATIAVNPSGQLCVLTGAISVTVPTPPAASFPQPASVVITTQAGVVSGAYSDGALVTIGSIADQTYTTVGTTGDVISILKGIFANVITPVAVSGSFTSNQTGTNIALVASQQIASPSTYGVAPVGSVLGVNSFVTNQPTVVLSGSPVSVGIAAGSSPINVTGNFATTTPSPQAMNLEQIQNVTVASPSTYGAAPVGSVQGVNAFVTNNVNVTPPTPLQVTFPASPVSVGIAAGSSPINVTGNFTSTPPSPQNTNLVQIQGVTVASASTYGAAPVGSVQGVNAFVTNNVNVTPPTPLQITLPASPIGVGVTNNVAVTTPTPLQITLPASPISVGIAGPTPLNMTLATGINIGQITGIPLASPTSYGVAPTGSVGAVNAFVTNQPTVVLSGSPVSVGIAGPTPLNVTLAASPLNVTQVGQSGQNMNLVQWQGIAVASASTYGVAPVGSVGGVNAFVTNNVNVTTPTPLQITLPASPISVGIAGPTPLNITVNNTPLTVALSTSPINVTQVGQSGQNMNLVQWQGVTIASASTYGVAPVGSTGGVNAFVTNGNPNGAATSANSQPVVIANDQTPLNVTLSASPMNITGATPITINLLGGQPAGTNAATNGNIIAWTASTSFTVTNAALALGATPGIIGIHQFGSANCSTNASVATPAVLYLQIFDATPHATGSDVTLGTTIPKMVVPIIASPQSLTSPYTIDAPGIDFLKGITVAFTTTAKGATATGVNAICSFVYN